MMTTDVPSKASFRSGCRTHGILVDAPLSISTMAACDHAGGGDETKCIGEEFIDLKHIVDG
jgi:hypothetical protein